MPVSAIRSVCIISYSGRADGNCAKIAAFVRSEIAACAVATVVSFAGVDVNRCGECRYECFGGMCPYREDDIQGIYNRILKADAVIHVIPVYGSLPCSNFFALSERAQGAMDDSGFEKLGKIKNWYVIVGNTGEAAIKAVLGENDALLTENDVLMLRSHDVGERSIRGNLIEYAYYRRQLTGFLQQIKLM